MVSVRELETKQHTLHLGDDDDEHVFTGTFLGRGTSHRRSHINHRPGDAAPRGVRCSGCRWTVSTVYWSETDEKYLVHIVGKSAVPGERDKLRTVWAEDADAVLDALLVAPPRRFQTGNANPGLELPPPNADALEEAAQLDPTIAEALRSWERT